MSLLSLRKVTLTPFKTTLRLTPCSSSVPSASTLTVCMSSSLFLETLISLSTVSVAVGYVCVSRYPSRMCWSLRPIPVVILARSISNFAIVPLAMSIGLTEIVPVILLVCPMIVSNGAFDSKVKTFRSSPMVKCVFAAHGLHGFAAHGLHGLAAHGLQGLARVHRDYTGCRDLQHGLHGLHGFSASSLAHGLQGFSWWSANDTALRSVKLRNNVSVKMVKRCIIFSPLLLSSLVRNLERNFA